MNIGVVPDIFSMEALCAFSLYASSHPSPSPKMKVRRELQHPTPDPRRWHAAEASSMRLQQSHISKMLKIVQGFPADSNIEPTL